MYFMRRRNGLDKFMVTIKVSNYAICLILSLMIGFIVAYILLRKSNIEATIARLSCFMNVVFVMLFGKLYTLMLYRLHGTYDNSKGILYMIATVPFASIGGMLGMLIGIETFNLIYNEHKYIFRTVYILMLPLIYSISKMGCHFAGCCSGINGIPIQIIEVICFGLIFVYGIYLYLMNRQKYLIAKLLIICSIAKFVAQFFRIEHGGNLLDANQIVCLIVLVASIIYIFREKGKMING